MSGNFFTLLIDDELITFEKNRVLTIEPAYNGTRIIIESSHQSEEPIIYTTAESYEDVMKSYSS